MEKEGLLKLTSENKRFRLYRSGNLIKVLDNNFAGKCLLERRFDSRIKHASIVDKDVKVELENGELVFFNVFFPNLYAVQMRADQLVVFNDKDGDEPSSVKDFERNVHDIRFISESLVRVEFQNGSFSIIDFVKQSGKSCFVFPDRKKVQVISCIEKKVLGQISFEQEIKNTYLIGNDSVLHVSFEGGKRLFFQIETEEGITCKFQEIQEFNECKYDEVVISRDTTKICLVNHKERYKTSVYKIGFGRVELMGNIPLSSLDRGLFSPCGKYLFLRYNRSMLRVYNLEDLKRKHDILQRKLDCMTLTKVLSIDEDSAEKSFKINVDGVKNCRSTMAEQEEASVIRGSLVLYDPKIDKIVEKVGLSHSIQLSDSDYPEGGLRFSNDGKYVVAEYSSKKVKVFCLNDMRCKEVLRLEYDLFGTASLQDCFIHPQFNYVVVRSINRENNNVLRVYELRDDMVCERPCLEQEVDQTLSFDWYTFSPYTFKRKEESNFSIAKRYFFVQISSKLFMVYDVFDGFKKVFTGNVHSTIVKSHFNENMLYLYFEDGSKQICLLPTNSHEDFRLIEFEKTERKEKVSIHRFMRTSQDSYRRKRYIQEIEKEDEVSSLDVETDEEYRRESFRDIDEDDDNENDEDFFSEDNRSRRKIKKGNKRYRRSGCDGRLTGKKRRRRDDDDRDDKDNYSPRKKRKTKY